MELLTDLMDRLASIEHRVVSLVQTLEQQEAVEQALGAADSDLREASAHVAQLADSMKSSAESLNEILVEFRSAVQVIREADPARVAAAVAEAQEFIARQHAETQVALRATAADSAQRHGQTQDFLQTSAVEAAQHYAEFQSTMTTSEEAAARRHGETEVTMSRQSAETNRGLNRLWGLGWGIIVAQAVGLALLTYTAFIK